MPSTYVVAVETIHVAAKDGIRTIYAGTPVASDDPAVKRNPGSFRTPEEIAETVSPTFGPVVEQATAAPGELRTTPKRRA